MSELVNGRTTERRTKRVRLREGVYALGQEYTGPRDLPGGPARVVHLVNATVDLDSPGGVTAMCGAQFAPHTLEVVERKDLTPHLGCRRALPKWPRTSTVSNLENDQVGTTLARRARPDSQETRVSRMIAQKIFNSRHDWELYLGVWTYTASFNGVLSEENQFPRGRDIGIEFLTAQASEPGFLAISSCGIREGCMEHTVRHETVPLDRVTMIDEVLEVQERRATSIDLQRLSWCLIVGQCSKTTADLYLM